MKCEKVSVAALLAASALAGLGCGGGGAEAAAQMKAAPFTEPSMLGQAAEPNAPASSSAKMSCTAEMMGPKR
jgi:hypothetical protein